MPGKLNPRYTPAFLISLCVSSLLALSLLTRPLLRPVASASATITVNTTADDDTSNGNCTLREAIQAANNDTAVDACAAGSGTDTIAFAIPGAGPHTIAPTSPLPQLTAPVVIDGTTQAGASCTTAGGLQIELNGASAGIASGLVITAGNSVVRGLVINRFSSNGVLLTTNGGNTVSCNYIGTNVAGTASLGNSHGVLLDSSNNNLLGGTNVGQGNLISGNLGTGVTILNTANNTIQGNLIGTNVTGTGALGNVFGLNLNSTTNTLIGGASSGARNVIAGNNDAGISLNDCQGTQILGNYIGTDRTGNVGLGNGGHGIQLFNTNNSVIGESLAGARNLISGNGFNGLEISGSSTGNQIQGNYIGTNAAGTAALSNSGGIRLLEDATNNQIGGPASGAGNLISGNTSSGIDLGSSNNTVQGNYIGTDVTGALPLGNADAGIVIVASNNTVGGTSAGARNLISGNNSGVQIFGGLSSGNQVQGNFIGTNATGTAALSNSVGILLLDGAANNQIGGTSVGAGNLISGNL